MLRPGRPDLREAARAREIERLVARGVRAALVERDDAEPTGRISVPPPEVRELLRERDARDAAAIVPPWKHWVRTGLVVAAICGAGATVVTAVVAAQGWVSRTVTLEVAPVRESVQRLESDVRAIRRAVESAP